MRFFPYSEMRKGQAEMIKAIGKALQDKRNILINAPTGIGKTVAALAPTVEYALKNKKRVFFLTSRQTHHNIALSTVRAISLKSGQNLKAVDIVGRQSLCLMEKIDDLFPNEFAEFCRSARKNGSCPFYRNTFEKGNLTKKAKMVAHNIMQGVLASSFEVKKACASFKLCPYELIINLAKSAQVIIADYYYLFNPRIRASFLERLGQDLDNIIAIVDEAHNLPQRIRNVMSTRLTSIGIRRAIQEAKKYKQEEVIPYVVELQDILNEEGKELEVGKEKLVKKEIIITRLNQLLPYEEIIEALEDAADFVRQRTTHSYLGRLADFLQAWNGDDMGFARILALERTTSGEKSVLNYKCLDPSIVSAEIGKRAHSLILMSATLSPLKMYADLLGLGEAYILSLKSPFPKTNRLNLIVPHTTTKYTLRNNEQFKQIASIILDVAEVLPGNIAVFFPSYSVLASVKNHIEAIKAVRSSHEQNTKTKNNLMWRNRPLLAEFSSMNKADKEKLIDTFKKNNKKGAILFGVISGSFAEGIDLPGDYLKCVIVVGIPFPKPDLETKELIRYYNKKFGRGKLYGYIFPTLNKIIQASGRCIRSEDDKGIVIFLDERYAWPIYNQFFPSDWWVEVTSHYKEKIREFFHKTSEIKT